MRRFVKCRGEENRRVPAWIDIAMYGALGHMNYGEMVGESGPIKTQYLQLNKTKTRQTKEKVERGVGESY